MKPPAVVDETSGEWRRDLSWSLRCFCGHLKPAHRYDGDRKSHPCSTGGCGCNTMRPQFAVFYEHREVLGLLEESADA